MFDDTYEPSPKEKNAYRLGYSVVNRKNIKNNYWTLNPFNIDRESLLWEAWEIGFNDAFNNQLERVND